MVRLATAPNRPITRPRPEPADFSRALYRYPPKKDEKYTGEGYAVEYAAGIEIHIFMQPNEYAPRIHNSSPFHQNPMVDPDYICPRH